MDEFIYDTSWNLFSVVESTNKFRELAQADQQDLNDYAHDLQGYLSTEIRPRYETEEEREKIGGLRECRWNPIDRKSDGIIAENEKSQVRGVWIEMVYDGATYKFVLLGLSSDSLPLLLSKSSPSTTLTKRFVTFLDNTFNVEFRPLKLPASSLRKTLHTYITQIYETITTDPRRNVEKILKSTIGSLKLTITVSMGAGNSARTDTNGNAPTINGNTNGTIAPNLKTIEIDIPPQTLVQLLSASSSQPPNTENISSSFLKVLAEHIHNRTGLRLPLHSTQSSRDPSTTTTPHTPLSPSLTTDHPLKLTKISTAAYALSVDGKLKLSRKALDSAVEFGEEIEDSLRSANEHLLHSVISESITQNG